MGSPYVTGVCQTEIDEFGFRLFRSGTDENVVGLDVVMDESIGNVHLHVHIRQLREKFAVYVLSGEHRFPIDLVFLKGFQEGQAVKAVANEIAANLAIRIYVSQFQNLGEEGDGLGEFVIQVTYYQDLPTETVQIAGINSKIR